MAAIISWDKCTTLLKFQLYFEVSYFNVLLFNIQLIRKISCKIWLIFAKLRFNSSAAHQAFKTNGAFYLFDHFDTFFSVIENVSQLQTANLVRAIDILYRTAENLGQMLDAYLKQDILDRQNDYLNLTKMVMFLLVSTVRAADELIKKNFNEPPGRKNKKKNNDQTSFLASYEAKRYDVLVEICNIMQLPIEKLWNMSIIDEDFVK